MGAQQRKARQRNELKTRILKAAEDLFARNGYDNVSMRKIAERIEYSPTTIYRLFENKAEIMRILIANGYKGVYRSYERILRNSGTEPPLETLGAIVRAYIEYALEHPNHYEMWFATGELQVVEDRLQLQHGDQSYSVYGAWLDRIDECRDEGVFGETDTMTVFQLLWASVHGLISLRIHHPEFPWLPLGQHMDQLLSLLRDGLVRHPSDRT